MWQALASIGGDLLGGLFGNSAQRSANRTNIMLNRENREWQERMSNTSYQRAVTDLQAAGLNPMLAYSQGGASSPQNTAARVEPVDSFAKGISSAGAKAAQTIQLENVRADTLLKQAQATKTVEEAKTSATEASWAERERHYNLERTKKEIELVISRFHLTDEQAKQVRAMLPLIAEATQTRTAMMKAQTNSATQTGRILEWDAKTLDSLGEVGSKSGSKFLESIINVILRMQR